MFGSNNGQWLLIFAVLFAFTVVMLSVALNEAMKSGYEVSKGLMDIPYYEVRSLMHEVIRAYRHNDWNFTDNETLEENLSKVFARHGYYLKIKFNNQSPILRINGSLITKNVNVTFRDKKVSRW